MIIGVIEWASDSAAEPTVFVGDDVASVRRAAAKVVARQIDDGNVSYIDGGWRAEHPTPDFDDEDSVEEWLSAVREATTDAWLGLYGEGCHYEINDARA